MDTKRIAIAAAFIVAGVGSLLWQISILHSDGYFYKIGLLSAMFIVVGIACLFIDFNDMSVEDEHGQRQNLSFSEMPMGWKVSLILGGIAGIGQLIYFEMGAPVLW